MKQGNQKLKELKTAKIKRIPVIKNFNVSKIDQSSQSHPWMLVYKHITFVQFE